MTYLNQGILFLSLCWGTSGSHVAEAYILFEKLTSPPPRPAGCDIKLSSHLSGLIPPWLPFQIQFSVSFFLLFPLFHISLLNFKDPSEE